MDLVIKNINSKEDLKFFNKLAEKFGFKTATLTFSEKEDFALGKLIEQGLKTGLAKEEDVMKTLRNIQKGE